MSPEERTRKMALFRRRLERLNEAVANNWPGPVVCLGLKMCLYSAIALYGERGSGIVSDMLLEHGREKAGQCLFCGAWPSVQKYADMCAACWEQAGEDDADAALNEEPSAEKEGA